LSDRSFVGTLERLTSVIDYNLYIMQHPTALKIALNIYDALEPECEVIHIAGSTRRNKPDVKDIEIICIPKTHTVGTNLFGENGKTVRTPNYLFQVDLLGTPLKGDSATGRYIQIQHTPFNELPNHYINIDLFTPEPHDYYRQYAIRTGSADYAQKVIAGGWRKLGWCGTHEGLRLTKDCINTAPPGQSPKWKCCNKHPQLPPVWRSEEEFFDWLQVPWIEPHLREIK
jgi:DNA polymerase/3'-5' exonuclease PolX